GGVETLRGRVEDALLRERRLARAADAGHADELPDGQLDVDLLQVVLGGALDAEPAGVVNAPVGRRDQAPAGQVRARDRLLDPRHLRRRAARDDAAPVLPPPPAPRARATGRR